jgi:hypothetical protein
VCFISFITTPEDAADVLGHFARAVRQIARLESRDRHKTSSHTAARHKEEHCKWWAVPLPLWRCAEVGVMWWVVGGGWWVVGGGWWWVGGGGGVGSGGALDDLDDPDDSRMTTDDRMTKDDPPVS